MKLASNKKQKWLTMKEASEITRIQPSKLAEMAETEELKNCFLRGSGEKNYSWAFPPDIVEQLVKRTQRILHANSPYSHTTNPPGHTYKKETIT